MTPREASMTVARQLLTQWSEQEGCTVVSRYEGDRWDKLVDIIATALDQQIEKDAKVAESFVLAISTDATVDCRADMLHNSRINSIATAIRQQGAR